MATIRKLSIAVAVLAAIVPLVAVPAAQAAVCNYTDFTAVPEIPNPNYYTPRPYSLAPDGGGLWDCFGDCGDGSQIRVIDDPAGGGNQVVEITGGTFTTTNTASDDIITRRTFTQCGPCADGTFAVSLRIKAGTGSGATLWRLDFGTNSTKLARLQGTATTVFGRAGGNIVTSTANLTGTGTFDTIVIRIDTVLNTTEYFFDAGSTGSFVSLGVLNHALDGPGNNINQFNITRVNNAGAAGHTVILDDIKVETCRDCHTNAAPKSDQNVSGPVGGAVTPASIVYNIRNYGTQSVTYTAQEVNASGTPTDHTWMGLSSGGGTLANPGDNQNIGATFNTTGLAAGAYTGYIKFTESSCTAPLNTYLRRVNLFVGIPPSCYFENFDSLALGALDGQGGWTGGMGGLSVVAPGAGGVGRAVELSLGSLAGSTEKHTMSCAPCTDGGIITVIVRIKGNPANSGGGSNAWRMWFSDPAGIDFARLQGQAGNTLYCRIGSTSTTTATQTISTTDYDTFKVVIDTVSDTTEFFKNDVSVGKFAHNGDINASQAAIGKSLGSITFERINRGDVSGSVLFDDIQVISCPVSCGIKVVPDQAGGSGVGRPVNYGTYSAAVQNDPGSLDPFAWDFDVANVAPSIVTYSVVESDINGNATDHTWLSLNNTGGTLGLDETDRVTAGIDITGLAPGEYIGFLKFSDNCISPNSYQLRTVRLVVIAPDTAAAGHACLVDSFSVPNGNLNTQMGWSGTAGVAIKVQDGVVRISANPSPPPGAVGGGDVASVSATTDVPDACVVQAQCVNQQTVISAKLKLQAGASGGGNIWQITFVSDNGTELGRFYRTGAIVTGRIGSFLTGEMPLAAAPAFSELEARINVSDVQTIGGIPPNATKFYIDGVPFPGAPAACGQAPPPNPVNPICHLGAGDILTQVSVSRTAGIGADFLTLDNVQVDYCAPACNDPVFDVRNQTNAAIADTFVDQHDLTFGFIPCVTGPTPGPGVFDALPFECQCMDVTGDQAVDINDFGVFQRCYSGSIAPANLNCDN